MSTLQSFGTQAYARPAVTVTTDITVRKEIKVVTNNGNRLVAELWETLNVDSELASPAIANVLTITISQGSDGDIYSVVVDDGVGADEGYAFLQIGTPGAAAIAAGLAKALDASPYVVATASAAVITVTGVIPGRDITLDVTNSTTAGNLVVAQVTAQSGTAVYRKMAELTVDFDIFSQSGSPQNGVQKCLAQIKWYNGEDPAVLERTGASTELGNSIQTLDAVMTANGISRV